MKKPVRGLKDNRILTPAQVLFLEKFIQSDLNNIFRLTGGTALRAFYLEHRLSEDLDFFSSENIPFYLPQRFLTSLDYVAQITHGGIGDRALMRA